MKLFKSCFNTRIGTLCYLWLDYKGSPGVAALGMGKNRMERYISVLKAESSRYDDIIIEDRKFPLLEKNIAAFLEGKLEDIGIRPVFLTGTEFQKRVWKETLEIPFGWTCSYGELADICGRPGAGRAVGNAMGRNPVMLIVPCHRIIKGDGSPGGFGARPGLKRELLANEGLKF